MKTITSSQWRAWAANVLSVLVPLIGYAILNQSSIEAYFPEAKWLPFAFPMLTTWYNSYQRSVVTKRSGTETGIQKGPDPLAQAAQASKSAPSLPDSPALPPVDSAATAAATALSVLPLDPVAQGIVDAALSLYEAQKQSAASKTTQALKTAYGLNAGEIAAGHDAIAKAPTAPGVAVGPGTATADTIPPVPAAVEAPGAAVASPSSPANVQV